MKNQQIIDDEIIDDYRGKALELSDFVRNFVPTGFYDEIGRAGLANCYRWYEVEAIEAWIKTKKLDAGSSTE